MFIEDDVIFAYTRTQAIADGELVDATSMAKEAGFRYPVALTRAVWCEYVEVPAGVEGQHEAGRLWDILIMLSHAIRGNKDCNELRFRLHVRNDNRGGMPPLVELKALCGPDDDGNPCITVMTLRED